MSAVQTGARRHGDQLTAKRVQRLVVNAGLNVSEVREFVDPDHAIQALLPSWSKGEPLGGLPHVLAHHTLLLTGGLTLVREVQKTLPSVVGRSPNRCP